MIAVVPIGVSVLSAKITPEDGWEALVGMMLTCALLFIELVLFLIFMVL